MTNEQREAIKICEHYKNILYACNYEKGPERTGQAIDTVLSLIKEVLTYPNFTQEEFERAKQIVRDSIMSESVFAYDKLQQELFPAIKKYAPKEERLRQLESLTLADIQNVYSKLISTANASATITAPFEQKPYLKDIFNNELSVGLPVFKTFSRQKGNSYKI